MLNESSSPERNQYKIGHVLAFSHEKFNINKRTHLLARTQKKQPLCAIRFTPSYFKYHTANKTYAPLSAHYIHLLAFCKVALEGLL